MKKIFYRNKILSAFLSYSFLFCILIFIINFIFYQYNDAFIWNADYLDKYLNLSIYYRDLLINLFNTGKLNVFSWNIGLGTNMLPNLIFIIGDIFSYISLIFSKTDLDILYKILIFIRLFLVGISFIIYSKYKKISNHSSVVGALIYTFSMFSLYFIIKNPYILNLMILFPLLMIGIEKLIIDNKKSFYILISFLITITNIYFVPIIFICILLYSSVLIFDKYKDYGFKLIFSAYLRVILSYLVSLLLSGFILIPLFYQLLNINIDIITIFTGYYKDLFLVHLVDNYNNVFIGINGIFLLYFPLVVKRVKENRNLFIFLCLIYIFFIVLGIYSSNFTNYFGFILLFIFSSLISNTIDLYSNISKSDFKWIISFIFINVLLILIFSNNFNSVMISLITVFGLLLVLLNKKELSNLFNKYNIYNFVFNLVLIISIGVSIYNLYDLKFNIIDDLEDINNYYSTNGNDINSFKDAIELVKEDSSFYRITKDSNKLHNASIYYDFNSIDGVSLFRVERYDELNKDLSNFSYMKDSFGNFNNRTKINSLLGNKYYIADKYYYVSEGYSSISKIKDTNVLKNNYFVEFGAFYDTYISIDDFNTLSNLEKENSLLKFVALNEEDIDKDYVLESDNFKNKINDDIKEVNYSSSIDLSDKEIIVKTEVDKKIILSIDDNDLKGELYLKIDNFKTLEEVNILVKHKDIEYNRDILGTEDILINLSAYSEINGDIEIYLSSLGNYSFDSLELFVVNFDSYESDISKLNSIDFEVLEYDSNYIKGKVNSSNKGILQFSTTYDKDFKVYIDGVEVDTLEVNKYFLGIYINEGEHIVEVKYNSSGYILGICLSSVGLIIFSIILVKEIKSIRNKKKKRRIK